MAGNLTIHGDMGTWCFARIDDMFKFFRNTGELKINAHYWAEKITSESRYGGPSERFNAATFKENVLAHLDDCALSEMRMQEVLEALESEVFSGEEDESMVRRALADFKHKDFEFTDSWEINGKAFTYHYLWCLYAVVWGIQQYDSAKAQLNADEPPAGGKP